MGTHQYDKNQDINIFNTSGGISSLYYVCDDGIVLVAVPKFCHTCKWKP